MHDSAKRAAWRRRYAATPKGRRARKDSQLKVKFGITIDTYDAMLKAQGWACEICGEKCPSGRALAVDHDRSTGKIRALLCAPCNTSLGLMKTPVRLSAAAEYLRWFQAKDAQSVAARASNP